MRVVNDEDKGIRQLGGTERRFQVMQHLSLHRGRLADLPCVWGLHCRL